MEKTQCQSCKTFIDENLQEYYAEQDFQRMIQWAKNLLKTSDIEALDELACILF